jgi:2',3'-cyclic-nucleotide 2'-phosphodiesterase
VTTSLRSMRILFIGDVVGRPGRNILQEQLPLLRARWKLDVVVVNGENAAGGFGLTEDIYNDFIDAGADAVTLGNHSWDQRETLVYIERAPKLVRPVNYPAGTPGRGATMIETENGRRVVVINAMGRLYMDALDDPFRAVEREVEACPLGAGCDAIIVDMHAEATSEKQAMGYFLDGRVSLVVGTHTHVPTADHRILPAGTAYQSDAGMTGNYQSILGMDRYEPVRRWLTKTPGSRLEVAEGPGTLCGLAVETNDSTGLAINVAPIRIGAVLEQALPVFWSEGH